MTESNMKNTYTLFATWTNKVVFEFKNATECMNKFDSLKTDLLLNNGHELSAYNKDGEKMIKLVNIDGKLT